jgi:hypothetical protein
MPFRVNCFRQLGSHNTRLPQSKLASPVLPKWEKSYPGQAARNGGGEGLGREIYESRFKVLARRVREPVF